MYLTIVPQLWGKLQCRLGPLAVVVKIVQEEENNKSETVTFIHGLPTIINDNGKE